MEEKNQRAIEFLRKKSDLNEGKRGKETFFYKNTRDVKIRILCTGMDFYCESEKRKQYGWSDFVTQNDATPYKKKNEWLAVKDQTKSTGEQCDLLYTLFQKWEEFSSSSEITQLPDTKAKDKKKSFEYVYESAGSVGKFNGNADEFLEENILGKVNGEKIKIPYVASWAVWSDDFSGKVEDIREELDANTILLAENISKRIEDPWTNFHGTSSGDSRLRCACEANCKGAYITDLIKRLEDANGAAAASRFENNGKLRNASLEMFIREIELLMACGLIKKDRSLYIVLLGGDTKKCFLMLKKEVMTELGNYFDTIVFGEVDHYSYTCNTKEKYKDHFTELFCQMKKANHGDIVKNPRYS